MMGGGEEGREGGREDEEEGWLMAVTARRSRRCTRATY